MSRLTACLGYIVSRDDVVKDGVGVQGAEKQDCAEQDVEQKCRVELRVESSGCSSTQAENNKQQQQQQEHAKVSAHPLFSAAQNSVKNRNKLLSSFPQIRIGLTTRRSGDCEKQVQQRAQAFPKSKSDTLALKVTHTRTNTSSALAVPYTVPLCGITSWPHARPQS